MFVFGQVMYLHSQSPHWSNNLYLLNPTSFILWPTIRLLCPLHPGLSVLRVPHAVQHCAGLCHVRLLRIRRLVLLLLLRFRGMRRLRPPLRHGLRHHWRVLRVCRLSGDLHGMLWAVLFVLRLLQGPHCLSPIQDLRNKQRISWPDDLE